MTKLNFDYNGLNSKVITRIDDTHLSLNRIESLCNDTNVPQGFNATSYYDSVKKIKKINVGLQNVRNDLIKANENYEEMESISMRNNAQFNSEFKLDYDEPIIKIN